MTRDEELIRECLRAAVEGPFFPEWEFSLLFGLERREVASVLASWPESDDPDTQRHAVNGTLNNLLGYPHRKGAVWGEYISVSREEVNALYRRWRWRGDRPGGLQ